MMARVFRPYTNTIAKASLVAVVFLVLGTIWVSAQIQRSPWVTGAGVVVEQPVPFSHAHHVGGLGLDCRYCHTTAEDSPFAGIPPTQTCMTCHSKVWTNAAVLEPVRESWRTGRPIAWQRVHNLPDYVYFNHSTHVQKGVGCSTCHGQVERMPLMYQAGALNMEWCLSCHREPERFLRPRSEVYNMNYQSPPNQLELGRRLAKEYSILPLRMMEDCSLCHR